MVLVSSCYTDSIRSENRLFFSTGGIKKGAI